MHVYIDDKKSNFVCQTAAYTMLAKNTKVTAVIHKLFQVWPSVDYSQHTDYCTAGTCQQ